MRELLRKIGIEEIGAVPLSECKITKKYLLEKANIKENATVIMMLLPYRSESLPVNFSVYASVRDYHRFVEELREKIDAYLAENKPHINHALFADHSPIDEVHASCIAGLGFIGDNGLLINEKYSSFVFLCELIIDALPDELGLEFTTQSEIKSCIHCGACERACPSGCIGKNANSKSECLSAITQKKGELTEEEIKLMRENNTVWGCDICQNACPFTKNAKYTEIEYFKKGTIKELTTELIEGMSDEEFGGRAFSWRGKSTVLRNLKCYKRH